LLAANKNVQYSSIDIDAEKMIDELLTRLKLPEQSNAVKENFIEFRKAGITDGRTGKKRVVAAATFITLRKISFETGDYSSLRIPLEIAQKSNLTVSEVINAVNKVQRKLGFTSPWIERSKFLERAEEYRREVKSNNAFLNNMLRNQFASSIPA